MNITNLDHDTCEGEHQDDKDQAYNQPRLSPELVAKQAIENEEGDIGNHRGDSQVTSPCLLKVVWIVTTSFRSHGRLYIANKATAFSTRKLSYVICHNVHSPKLVVPISNNLQLISY